MIYIYICESCECECSNFSNANHCTRTNFANNKNRENDEKQR